MYCPMCMTNEDEMECMGECPSCGEPLEDGDVEDDN